MELPINPAAWDADIQRERREFLAANRARIENVLARLKEARGAAAQIWDRDDDCVIAIDRAIGEIEDELHR
jgi:hypothetical protein